MKTLRSSIGACVLATMAGTAQAALVSLGDGTVQDTLTNLVWLQDWNRGGTASRSAQQDWAANLSVAGQGGWALPTVEQFYDLFRSYGDLTQVAAFSNVQLAYWTGTDHPGGTSAWLFSPKVGIPDITSPEFLLYAVAVRPAGDSTAVPEPGTLALALLALATARRRPGRGRQGETRPGKKDTPRPAKVP